MEYFDLTTLAICLHCSNIYIIYFKYIYIYIIYFKYIYIYIICNYCPFLLQYSQGLAARMVPPPWRGAGRFVAWLSTSVSNYSKALASGLQLQFREFWRWVFFLRNWTNRCELMFVPQQSVGNWFWSVLLIFLAPHVCASMPSRSHPIQRRDVSFGLFRSTQSETELEASCWFASLRVLGTT